MRRSPVLQLLFYIFILSIQAVSARGESLSALYTSVPRPPADIETALSWVNEGEIVEPTILAFEARLAAEEAAVATLNGGQAPELSGHAVVNLNAASADLQAVAASFRRYLEGHSGDDSPHAALAKRKRWLQRAYGQEQLDISQAMTPCQSPCTDNTVYQANLPYLRQRQSVLKLEIRSWNALFDDWRKTRRRDLMAADTVLAAIDTAAASDTDKRLIAAYRGAILEEITLMLSITTLAVLRVEAVMRGLDGSEPDAISGATKKSG